MYLKNCTVIKFGANRSLQIIRDITDLSALEIFYVIIPSSHGSIVYPTPFTDQFSNFGTQINIPD